MRCPNIQVSVEDKAALGVVFVCGEVKVRVRVRELGFGFGFGFGFG